MPIHCRSFMLAAVALALCACASFQPVPGSARDVVPRYGDREVMLTDTAGRDHRLTAVRLVGDSVVGLSTEDARPITLAVGEIRQVKVLTGDPILSFATSTGMFLLIIGAAAVLAVVAHSAGR